MRKKKTLEEIEAEEREFDKRLDDTFSSLPDNQRAALVNYLRKELPHLARRAELKAIAGGQPERALSRGGLGEKLLVRPRG
jgi:hypothetical protein